MNTKDRKHWIISKGRIIICISAGCDDKAISHGYCWKHYDEFIREELEENKTPGGINE